MFFVYRWIKLAQCLHRNIAQRYQISHPETTFSPKKYFRSIKIMLMYRASHRDQSSMQQHIIYMKNNCKKHTKSISIGHNIQLITIEWHVFLLLYDYGIFEWHKYSNHDVRFNTCYLSSYNTAENKPFWWDNTLMTIVITGKGKRSHACIQHYNDMPKHTNRPTLEELLY